MCFFPITLEKKLIFESNKIPNKDWLFRDESTKNKIKLGSDTTLEANLSVSFISLSIFKLVKYMLKFIVLLTRGAEIFSTCIVMFDLTL